MQNQFAAKLQNTRSRRRLSVREAATQAGVSFSTFSRVENGKAPDVQTLAALAKWTGCGAAFALRAYA